MDDPSHQNAGSVPKVICIMPTLNEIGSISSVLSKTKKYVDEIVVVDGHSVDGTVSVALMNGCSVIIQRGKGKGAALREAFDLVNAEYVVMMDADGSMDPSEIPRFLEPLRSGADIVKGSRFLPGGGTSDMTLMRRFGNKLFMALTNILFSTNYTDLCYGFKAFKGPVIKNLNIDLRANGFEIETEISIKAAKGNYIVCEVPSFEHGRRHGRSHLMALTDGMHILKTIIREYLATFKGG